MSTRTWTDEEFIVAVKNNISISGVLRGIGLRVTNGNFGTVKKYVTKFSLETSHWLGQINGGGKGITFPLVDILTEHSSYQSNVRLRKRLINEGILLNRCSVCFIDKWNDKDITIQLDHINGVHNDNRLENLRLLCPNCHSQTDTFCGRNIKINRNKKEKINNFKCSICFSTIKTNSIKCSACVGKSQRKFEISKEELEKLVWEIPTAQLAMQLNVSDKAIGKRCKKFGIQKPPRGYWQKLKAKIICLKLKA